MLSSMESVQSSLRCFERMRLQATERSDLLPWVQRCREVQRVAEEPERAFSGMGAKD